MSDNQLELNRREVANLIGLVLEKRNLTQTQLADILGVREETISRWANGHSPISRAEVFFLQSMVKPEVSIKSEKPQSGPVIPIYSNIPGNKDFNPENDKIGEIVCPPWMIGGNRKDCYVLQVPGSADMAIITPRASYRAGDWAIVKIDDNFGIRKLDDVHVKFDLEVKGIAVFMIKRI